MRNLKKILALVLALVMSFSLMATANAFKDDQSIDATFDEAVTVLANLGVFEGYEDGSFQPKGEITRAEVAAIIYRIVTGDVDDTQVGIYADYNKFTDVKSGSWYAGYVNYCANAEYIKGYGDGTFGPQDKVTGYQALAMILRAVGYDKMGEFTGAGWQVQTAARANSLGITDNVNSGLLGQAATREIVAEILFRSILVPQVTYTVAFGYQNKSYEIFGSENASIGAETFGLAQTVGEITAVGYQAGTTTFTTVNEKNVLGSSVVVADTDANWENIGYMAYAYTVKTAGAKTRTAVSDVTVIGDSLLVNTDGTSYGYLTNYYADVEGNARFYLNGVELTSERAIEDALALVGETGVKVDFIDNDFGGKAEVVVVTHYTPAEVTGIATDVNAGYNATKKNTYYLDNLSTDASNWREPVGAKYLVCADELAMGDVVTYVKYNTEYYVTVAPLTTDTFDAITRAKVDDTGDYDYIYTIGDTDYVVADDYDLYNNGNTLVKANLTYSVDIYTDPFGYILSASLTNYDTNFVFVMANEQTTVKTGTTETKLAFADGTIEWLPVDALYDGDAKTNFFAASTSSIEPEQDKGIAKHIYSYYENNGVYTLYDVWCDELTGIDYTNGKATIAGDDDTLGLNKASVVVDLRPGYVGTVYTGYNEVPSLTNATIHYVSSYGIITLAYLTAGTNSSDLSANFIVYNTDVNKVKVTNNQYAYYLDVLVDGAVVEDYELTTAQYYDIAANGVGHYVYNAKGILTYTSFADKWVDVSWSRGTLTIYGKDGIAYVEYDEVPFNVLNIANGTADNYSMLYGLDFATVKAYVVYNTNNSVKEIYIIADPATLIEE